LFAINVAGTLFRLQAAAKIMINPRSAWADHQHAKEKALEAAMRAMSATQQPAVIAPTAPEEEAKRPNR
jgi:hypothetical protein